METFISIFIYHQQQHMKDIDKNCEDISLQLFNANLKKDKENRVKKNQTNKTK